VDSPLPYLLLPLLVCVALLPRWRGAAAARLVIAAFGLATLHVGTGSLLPSELRTWAAQGSSQEVFVSLSTGMVLGGLGLWSRRGWLWHLAAIPVLSGLLLVFWPVFQVLPLLLGAVLGAIPLLVGGLVPRMMGTPQATYDRHSLAYGVVALLAVVFVATGSLALLAVAPLLPLIEGEQRTPGIRRRGMVLPLLAALIFIALIAYAISLGAAPAAVLTSIGFSMPLPGAVERVVGASILAAGLLMVAPWPLHRFGPGVTLVPAAAIMTYHIAGTVAPVGVAEWLPLAAMVLVPSAIAAAWRGHWANALASVAVLTVPRPGWQGLGLLLLMFVSLAAVFPGNPRPPNRISFPSGALAATLLALALAFATPAVLRHEVVLGSLLAAGLATAAARPTWQPTPP
jgi:hypothetical protein